jgi:hypothetical protein
LARFRSFVIIIIIIIIIVVVVVGVVVVGLARRQRSDPHDPRAPKKRQLGSLRCVSAGITALSLWKSSLLATTRLGTAAQQKCHPSRLITGHPSIRSRYGVGEIFQRLYIRCTYADNTACILYGFCMCMCMYVLCCAGDDDE